jgi:hypothetical protein
MGTPRAGDVDHKATDKKDKRVEGISKKAKAKCNDKRIVN